ncbi:MAG: TetR/AcrR family transcriptional regulator [Aggregatilineales bacterium]
MARTINKEEHANKRNEILDEVQMLIYTKGYEQMTIQDILNKLQISKGAFYHYFDSKQALLTALLERIQDQMEQMLTPIVQNPNQSALEKLNLFFASIGQWKTARRSMLMGILRVWYNDDNAIVRQKMRISVGSPVASLLTEVIHQGIEEGVLQPAYPDQVAHVIFGLMQNLGDSVSTSLLAFNPKTDDLQSVLDIVHSYIHAIETVLGAPEGSLPLFPDDLLKIWFLPEDEAVTE